MLPVEPKFGRGTLKLKTDMTGVSGGKPTKANKVGTKVGSMKKTMSGKSGPRKGGMSK